VYSILFSLLDALGTARTPQIRVLGSDISTRVLAVAREGAYAPDRISTVPPGWLQRFFRKASAERFTIREEYRSSIEFQRLNLMNPFPSSFRFPVIFCRNVMIYFNKATQGQLVRRLAEALEPGGYLFTGHAESLTGLEHGLKYVRPAVYRNVRA
jgi:chemotaxis protein methyltransferase CheR